MKHSILKKIVVICIIAAMALGVNQAAVIAATAPTETITYEVYDTTSGTFAGLTASGVLFTDALDSTATTSFTPTGGYIAVEAYIYYWYGGVYYTTTSGVHSATNGGVTATATKYWGDASVVAGRSKHTVRWTNYSWNDEIILGNVPTSYTWK